VSINHSINPSPEVSPRQVTRRSPVRQESAEPLPAPGPGMVHLPRDEPIIIEDISPTFSSNPMASNSNVLPNDNSNNNAGNSNIINSTAPRGALVY